MANNKKRRVWKREEETMLLELWADHYGDLRRAKRNNQIYHEMATIIDKYTDKEIHIKIKNMTKKYR